MEITINNQNKTLTGYSTITVQQLLDVELPDKQTGIAIAINNKVVPKVEWSFQPIAENDHVLIIRATQGG